MSSRLRLAIIVSHPIQYYVPLYRRLAMREDIELKVFFTWHAGQQAQHDPGFDREVAWDIPLTQGYEHELVRNIAKRPGSDHFWGIRTPDLVDRVVNWRPDAVHITGYAYASHARAMRALYKRNIPILFRGDSHLLEQPNGWQWFVKRNILRRVYSWAAICLFVGKNNHEYYRRIGVPEGKLRYCPHCIEVERFGQPNEELEANAKAWRNELRIAESAKVILYAGKFEDKKQTLELAKAVLEMNDPSLILVLVGDGPLKRKLTELAKGKNDRVVVLPFQNQKVMPVIYRIADVVVLPSAYNETWGLALNEAIACGRRVIASDHVGGAVDIITSNNVGAIFRSGDWHDFKSKLTTTLSLPVDTVSLPAKAQEFDTREAESYLMKALLQLDA